MKIMVANNAAPFVRGGAELLADRLVVELRRAGHEAELMRLPLGDTPEQVLDSITAAVLMEAINCDRIVGLKFPAYLIPHPDMVIWLVHQFRQVYDPAPVGWPHEPRLDAIAGAVRASDEAAFAAANRLYAISPMVAGRLERVISRPAKVLLTPPHAEQAFRCEPAEDYVVALGRLSASKRQRLAIEAMAHASPGYRLVVAGAPETPDTLTDLEDLIARNGLADRVQLIPRFITEEEKLSLVGRCLGSVYLPIDEDSYGYVCYEAAMSSKPSITATDSGGTLTLVEHERTGIVTEPDPESVAAAFDRLASDPVWAAELGRGAQTLALGLDLSWRRVIDELTR